jgi:D-alanyl-D-alanine carboxypeptidase/D-alanyl-D-alanine-endopeptidase (penicillin-binding protein 4)
MAILLAAWSLAAAAAAPLPAEVRAALERAKVPPEAISIVVEEVGGAQRPRLAWHEAEPVNPASLMKLATTLAALELLGPAWTWQTPVWLTAAPDANGVLDGSVVIQGSGDPKLVMERLWLLLRRVQQLGVREIRGDIVLDRSAFPLVAADPGEFDGEPLRAYNVQPDALLLNYKAVVYTFVPDASRGVAAVAADPPLAGLSAPATVPLAPGPCDDWRKTLRADMADPARPKFAGAYPAACGERSWTLADAEPRSFNARALAAMWRELGGTLRGSVREGPAPATPPTFQFASPPLSDVVREINKFSNNVMARQLFLTLGRTQRGSGTPEAARQALGDWLAARIGAEQAGAFVIDNGSGLARESRGTARALAALLQAGWASPAMGDFLASLPVSGSDGTLRRARAAPGRAWLKTGSLRDVAGIAGYVLGASGRRHVLVAVIHHPNANDARPALEALMQWTAADGPSR